MSSPDGRAAATNAPETMPTPTTTRRRIPTSSRELHAAESADGEFVGVRRSSPTSATRTPTSSSQQQYCGGASPNASSPAAAASSEDWVTSTTHAFEESITRPASEALHSFFYPPARQREFVDDSRSSPENSYRQVPDPQQAARRQTSRARSTVAGAGRRQPPSNNGSSTEQSSSLASGGRTQRRRRQPQSQQRVDSANTSQHSNSGAAQQQQQHHQEFDEHFHHQQQEDKKFVERFWTAYDDIVILSLFTQVGIVARLGVSTWFTVFDGVFSNGSPLFVNLPLNCLSCFLMGCLASGESLMEIIATRFSPPRLQQALHERQLEARRKKGQYEDNGSRHNHNNNGMSEKDQRGVNGVSSALSSDDSDELPIQHMATTTSLEADDEGGSSDDGVHRFPMEGNSPTQPWNPLQARRAMRRRRKRRRRRPKRARAEQPDRFWWEPPVRLNEELRDVQLLALERRIRQSKCLLLFPIKKEDVDVMEHYFDEGYRKDNEENEEDPSVVEEEDGDEEDGTERGVDQAYGDEDDEEETLQRVMRARRSLENDLALEESEDPELARKFHGMASSSPHVSSQTLDSLAGTLPPSNDEGRTRRSNAARRPSNDGTVSVELHGEQPASGTDLNQMVNEVSANVTENITRLRRANLTDGWDVGTDPDAMSDDIMLGLRLGFCGALSSFSSWNSAMLNLIRAGHVGEAVVGYMLGLQLPIVAYRFGQHVAVFSFIWRCRRETKRDERRGYGIRLNMNENSERDGPPVEVDNSREASERETPSIRAVATALFIMALVTQSTSIFFYSDYESQVVAFSLLFSPLGVITRWRLSRYNTWRPTFPIGTFICNIVACALSGELGNLLAGNPDERERLVLVSLINGFGGTLSSVAAFIVEVLAGIDPVLMRADGVTYALISVFSAMAVGFLFTASADWADKTE